MERQSLQQRLEEQLLQVSSLQASLDQQRLAQAALEERGASTARRNLQLAAEKLEQARELLQARENEVRNIFQGLSFVLYY